MAQRAILHVDMDAFYASVEQRDAPELQGKPVIVGGTGRRGVVAAASYEVRRYGVHSAMPVARARRLCPEAIVVRPRMSIYVAESKRIFEIFEHYTPQIEPLSLDEAFLDVSASLRLHGDAVNIGRRIKQEIRAETRLTASVGIAPNKFLAKLASDQDKPDGLCVVEADRVQAFLDPLPVRRIWGIGPKAGERLARLGITTIANLRSADSDRLKAALGGYAARLQALARGEDDRPVEVHRAEKSVSNEVTFEADLTDRRACETRLLALAASVGARLRRKDLRGKTVSVKIRTTDFRTYTRQRTLEHAIRDDRTLGATAKALFREWWDERGPAPIRLLGVGTGGLVTGAGHDLFAAPGEGRLDQVADRVRARFGGAALKPAALVRRDDDDR